MGSVLDLVHKTKLKLYGGDTFEVNRLADAITDTATTIPLDFPVTSFPESGVASIDNEVMLIWAVSTVSNELTVERAYRGTTAAAHDAGAIVEADPMFPQAKVIDELKTEIMSWGTKLWQVGGVNYDVTLNQRIIDLTGVPEDFLWIIDTMLTPWETGIGLRRLLGRVERNVDTDVYPSGSVFITNAIIKRSTVLRMVYARPFDVSTFDVDTDLLDDCGLPAQFEDIAATGATWRLLLPREARRTQLDAQVSPNDLQGVPPGAAMQTADGFKRMRDLRIKDESNVLQGKYPLRIG